MPSPASLRDHLHIFPVGVFAPLCPPGNPVVPWEGVWGGLVCKPQAHEAGLGTCRGCPCHMSIPKPEGNIRQQEENSQDSLREGLKRKEKNPKHFFPLFWNKRPCIAILLRILQVTESALQRAGICTQGEAMTQTLLPTGHAWISPCILGAMMSESRTAHCYRKPKRPSDSCFQERHQLELALESH